VKIYNATSRMRCTTELADGRFCDTTSAEGAPFPICPRHAAQLYGWMQGMVAEVQGKHREYPELYAAVVQDVADDQYAKANTRRHQIYYVRIGELIKIGTTANLQRRISQYPPNSELLAQEPGGEDMESRRHAQFRHLLTHRKEWFRPGPDLMDHIAKLSYAEHG